MKDIKKVLFVCTGNSCRSIMAEAYFKMRQQEEKMEMEVASAGTMGIDGMMPADNTIKMLKKEGIDPNGYTSSALTDDLIEWADIILVMDQSHKFKVLTQVPEAAEKVRLLGEFKNNSNEIPIPDPIGRPLSFYEFTFNLIQQSIEEFIKWLKK